MEITSLRLHFRPGTTTTRCDHVLGKVKAWVKEQKLDWGLQNAKRMAHSDQREMCEKRERRERQPLL